MAINKFQRSVFSQTIGPIELKFQLKTSYDKLAKIYAKYFGHMTKMATTPIYGKNHLKIFFSRTRRMMTLGLDKLGVFHANQISMCLDPHLN